MFWQAILAICYMAGYTGSGGIQPVRTGSREPVPKSEKVRRTGSWPTYNQFKLITLTKNVKKRKLRCFYRILWQHLNVATPEMTIVLGLPIWPFYGQIPQIWPFLKTFGHK